MYTFYKISLKDESIKTVNKKGQVLCKKKFGRYQIHYFLILFFPFGQKLTFSTHAPAFTL